MYHIDQEVESSGTKTSSKGLQKTNIRTDTPQFNAWFGASKVVNPDGTPKVCYHGVGVNEPSGNTERGAPFSQFQVGKNRLIYTAESSDYASNFTHLRDIPMSGGRVYPLYVRVENPIDFTEFGVGEISLGSSQVRMWMCPISKDGLPE